MSRTFAVGFSSLAMLLASLACVAQGNPPATPPTLAGGKVVSADEAKKLLDAKKAVFVDTRSAMNFGKGHVPGAVSLQYGEKSEFAENFDASKDRFDLAKLPPDKNAALVFYSHGPTGWKSYKAAVLAVRAGYKSVNYLRGGMDEWETRKYPVEN